MRPLLVALLTLSVTCSAATGDVVLVEDHGEALARWAETGVRGANVIHFDAHADLQPVSPSALAQLKALYERGDWSGLDAANDAGEGGLYHCGDFLYAAHALGIAGRVYWVIPFRYSERGDQEGWLQALLDAWFVPADERHDFRWLSGCYQGTAHGVPLAVCEPERLPRVAGPLVLSFDADFVPPYAEARGWGRLETVRAVTEDIRRMGYRPQDAVVSYSMDNGYLAVIDRWWVPVLAGALGGGDIGKDRQRLETLDRATSRYLADDVPGLADIVIPVPARRREDPAFLCFAAFAGCGLGIWKDAEALAERACRMERGYCHLLLDLAQLHLDAGRLDRALGLFRLGYSLNPEMNYRQYNLAEALRAAGRTREAQRWYDAWLQRNGRCGAPGVQEVPVAASGMSREAP